MKNNGIYVASPLGFSEVGRFFMEQKIFPLLKELGFEIIDPWTLTDQKIIDSVLKMPYGSPRKDAWVKVNDIIGANNAKGIRRSKGILAILDGTDVDSGTASEIGYGAALKKPIVGYRGDFRLSADNEGSIVNLQVEYFIDISGGMIVYSFEELKTYLPHIISWNSRG